MTDVTIRCKPNGPLIVQGKIQLLDDSGQEIPLEKETIALCRCGASVRKPFCDGAHSRIDFEAAEAAVRAEKQGS